MRDHFGSILVGAKAYSFAVVVVCNGGSQLGVLWVPPEVKAYVDMRFYPAWCFAST